MNEQIDYPLGKILHIINNEGICRPKHAFIAKGARVITLDRKLIGTLGDPFGPVDHPFQSILLKKGIGKEIIGKPALAQHLQRRRKNKTSKRR